MIVQNSKTFDISNTDCFKNYPCFYIDSDRVYIIYFLQHFFDWSVHLRLNFVAGRYTSVRGRIDVELLTTVPTSISLATYPGDILR